MSPSVQTWYLDTPIVSELTNCIDGRVGEGVWASLIGPDRAQLRPMASLDELEKVGDVWLRGRIFGPRFDCCFRIDGPYGLVVLFQPEGDDSSGTEESKTWTHNGSSERVLFHDDDRRLPRGIDAPSGGRVRVDEYIDKFGRPAWSHYIGVEQGAPK